MADSPTSRRNRRLTVLRIWICVFWLSIFVATHVPLPEQIETLPGTDKHLHFGAYFVLAALLMFWNGVSSAATRRRALTVILMLAVYAAADELLQLLVDRRADLLDWAADVVGAVVGAVAVSTIARVLRTRSAE